MISEALVTSIVGFLSAVLAGILLWLIRDKVNTIEARLDAAAERREAEQDILVTWLLSITEAIHQSSDGEVVVDLPDEVVYKVDVEQDDKNND